MRSKHENALPIIVTHGWPGSIIEQMKIIDPLTNPTAHGGTAADAFHLVIPSLPGYGFSGKPTAPGWNPVSIAKAWATLMQRLGYTKYVAQGGDWGNAISEVMALQQPPGLLGIHTNMAATVPPDVSKALSAGGPPPAGLSPEEKHAWDQLDDFYKNGLGYANEMAIRPQTLYGIVNSPVGLAAWILDHDIRSYQMIARVFDGKPEGLTRDDILDNITLYWLTNTAISSARLYWDTAHNLPPGGFFDVRGVKLPVGVSAFADEIYQAPKSWAEKAYVKLVHYSDASQRQRTSRPGSSLRSSCPMCAQPSNRFARSDNEKNGARRRAPDFISRRYADWTSLAQMKTRKLSIGAVLVIAVGAPIAGSAGDTKVPQLTLPADERVAFFHGLGGGGPVASQSELASLTRADEWLNSPPLTTQALRGKVVLVHFWTYTCINWLRTQSYLRAWAEKYKDKGLVVIGVHTPEFPI